MNKHLQQIINQLRSEGKDYTDFRSFLDAIKVSGANISKDEILQFVANDYRIQLHTTPNSIAKLIAHLAEDIKPQSGIDICCGTGNILYYLQNEVDDLTGVEITENVAELIKYFIPDLNIVTADSFQYPFSRKYDLVVGNIPFGMRVELDGKRMPGEEAFLRKAHSLITENGKVIMLVPYSVLLSDQFRNFRNDFTKYLKEVIVLPSGTIRNTQIKTALLILNAKETKEVKVTELNQFEKLVIEYKSALLPSFNNAHFMERWDPGFHLSKESSFYRELDSFQTKELQELAQIIKGKFIPADTLQQVGDYLYLKPVHIQKDHLNLEYALKYVDKECINDQDYKYILQSGDIVISTIFNDLKMYVYQAGDVPAVASNNLAIIRSSRQDYILSYLRTDQGKRIFKTQADDLRKGVTIPHISIKDLATIKIPILPLADLNSLGDVGISRSTEAQLLDALEQLREYKNQVQKLEKEKEEHSVFKAFIDDRFNRIESQLQIVNKKLDDLLSILKELRTDFEQVQKLPREDEEKLFKLCQKIDARLDSVYKKEQQTIEGYIDEIKRWLDLWELLDIQSQKFLPIAEFIFDELSKFEDADYAPFVVQYCRTLENEILKKLFETYHSIGLQGINRADLIKSDLENQKTGKFALAVKRNNITYTLGDMNFIMALIKEGGNTLADSKLLQHFRAFVISFFEKKIVEDEFLKDVNKITNDFRNKAAHPYSVSVDLARECQILLRKSLNVFMESIKISKEELNQI